MSGALIQFFTWFRMFSFPGVFVHELAHELGCRILGVRVVGVRYFVWEGETLGDVAHSEVSNCFASFIISFAPLFLNTVLGLWIVRAGSLSVIGVGAFSFLDVFIFWVGFSILAHAIPSCVDVQCFLSDYKTSGVTAKILGFPLWLFGLLLNFSGLRWFQIPLAWAAAAKAPYLLSWIA